MDTTNTTSTTSTTSTTITSDDPRSYEPHPDTSKYAPFTPNPSNSLSIPTHRLALLQDILSLYSGCPSESALRRYALRAIYDDPFSYCDTRYKIAGQWYGLPKLFSNCETEAYEVVKNEPSEMLVKLRQRYTLRGLGLGKTVDSLVALVMDSDGNVKYHKDLWGKDELSKSGIGAGLRTANG